MTEFHRLDTPSQTLLLRIREARMAEAIYWGPALDPAEPAEALAAALAPDLGGGMLDALPPLSICPEAATHSAAGRPARCTPSVTARPP